jgi:hypothetical protein
MNKLFALIRASLAFAFLAAAGAPAIAATGTYEKPVLMYVILAKVWGNVCPDVVLTESEASEIQAFIDRFISAVWGGDASSLEIWTQGVEDLERDYTDKYSVPGKCGEIKPGSVQTLLRNIRMATADPAFWAELRGA